MDFSWRSFPLHHRFRFNLYILTVWNDIYVFMSSCVERLFYLLYRIWSYVCWFRSLQCAFYSSKSRSLELTVYITSLGCSLSPIPVWTRDDMCVYVMQISFSCLVFPALLSAYSGQAAYLTKFPENVANTFYDCIPGKSYRSIQYYIVLNKTSVKVRNGKVCVHLTLPKLHSWNYTEYVIDLFVVVSLLFWRL